MRKLALLIFLIPFTSSMLFAAEPKADKVRTSTTNFNGNLNSSDTDVQKALDKLDNVVSGDAAISNVEYGASWDGITTIAPSKNSLYDKINTLVSCTLANIQSALTNDFHNIGGTDDDTPDSDAEVPDAITVGATGTVHLTPIQTACSSDFHNIGGTDANTTYTAGGTLLQLVGTTFSLKEGTLTTTKGCRYVSGTGLVCDQDYLTSFTESDPTYTTWYNSGAPTLTTLDTGQGTNELYDMDQNVQTTDNVVHLSLALGKNGTGGTEGILTLRDGANPGTTATWNYTKLADLEAVNGLVKCNGSGNYSAASAGTDYIQTEVDTTVNTSAEIQAIIGAGVYETYNSSKVVAEFTITNGNTAIDATVTDPVACVRIPVNRTITGWYLDCDQSGSIVLDVWKNTWDDTPEANADSIAGTEKPTLSGDVSASDTNLTSMTTAWNTGQNVCIEIESAATVTKCRCQFVGY